MLALSVCLSACGLLSMPARWLMGLGFSQHGSITGCHVFGHIRRELEEIRSYRKLSDKADTRMPRQRQGVTCIQSLKSNFITSLRGVGETARAYDRPGAPAET